MYVHKGIPSPSLKFLRLSVLDFWVQKRRQTDGKTGQHHSGILQDILKTNVMFKSNSLHSQQHQLTASTNNLMQKMLSAAAVY